MNLTIGWDKLETLLAEGLEDLAFQDWAEVEVHTDQVPLAIDWGHMMAQERLGTYRVISARIGGELAGYNSFFINRHTRARDTLFAINDALYLAPQYRQGWNGVRFLRESDRLLKEAGVAKVQYGIKTHMPAGGHILARLGYEHIEDVYAKIL
jgi:hypothetical protein